VLVVAWVEGRTLQPEDLRDEGTLARAAEVCRRLHAGPRFDGDFDMFALQRRYLSLVTERGFRLPARYRELLPEADRIAEALAVRQTPTVPCNNDLLAANFIDDGQRVWLIDYEYSGNNDACFELGNTSTECSFTPEQTEAWTEAYFGAPSPADLARVRLQALCSQYGWSLWGFIQAATSPIDYDFHGWGMERFEKAEATFRGPELPQLLEDVARG
jgi:thiamine kinase-like enzyme